MAVDVTGQVMARQMLLQSERNLRNLVLKAPVAICILKGPKHIVETANERMFEFWGKSAGEVMYKPIFEGLQEAGNQGFELLLDQVYTTGKTCFAQAVPVNLPRDGSMTKVYVNFVYEAYREADDRISGVIVVATEVTDQVLARQQIEAVVQSRTKELQAINQDLQQSNAQLAQFAYIASHDLQEPLRKVSTFTDMLEQSLGPVSEVSQNFLHKIKSSTSRMVHLIRDVLSYSQLSAGETEFTRVDLGSIVGQVLSDFELLIQEKNAVVQVAPMPAIEAIPLQISQLFSNLLGNALKFARKDLQPVVTITVSNVQSDPRIEGFIFHSHIHYYHFEIRDNGIGFNPTHAAHIFQIFQRLHGRTEYAGTGIGLAICKKIVENHHGVIYATGAPNEGATFHVLLPAMQSI